MEDTTNTKPNDAHEQAITSEPFACSIPAPESKRSIKHLLYTFTTLAVFAFISIAISIGIIVSQMGDSLLISENDDYIAEAIARNVQVAKNKHQAVQKWCDVLNANGDIPVWRFEPTSSENNLKNRFVLNKTAARLLTEGKKIPQDLVVMFHGTTGWNQIGGKEKLARSYESDVVPVFLGDYKTRFIPLEKIDRLRWNITDVAQPLYNTNQRPFYILDAIVIAIGLYILILRRQYVARYWLLTVIVAAASCFVGYFFACGSVHPLYFGEPARIIDYTTVYIIGIVTGASFVLLFAPSAASCENDPELFLKAILLGGLCGLAASTFTHIYIMIFRQTTTYWGIIGGAGYGIYAGVVLGVITYWMTYLSGKLKQQCQPPRPSDTTPCEGGEL